MCVRVHPTKELKPLSESKLVAVAVNGQLAPPSYVVVVNEDPVRNLGFSNGTRGVFGFGHWQWVFLRA
jgi:hypothetical protein